jgi:hypothetical protein
VEERLVLLVGELRVGDAEARPEIVTPNFGEAAVGLGFDSGDEEAGVRVDTARVGA